VDQHAGRQRPGAGRRLWPVWAGLALVLCAALGAGLYFLLRNGDTSPGGAAQGSVSVSPVASPMPAASPSPVVPQSVVVVTPADGTSVAVGEVVHITVRVVPAASAGEVRVAVNGHSVGTPLIDRPYAVDWVPGAEANYSIVAEALAEDAQAVRSDPVVITARRQSEPDPPSAPEEPDDGTLRGWGAFFYASESYDVAEARAAEVRGLGFPAAVLNTIDYVNLGKPGQEVWVVCAGPYASHAEAAAAADGLAAAGVPGAYAKEIY
jgi:hypothetical protein